MKWGGRASQLHQAGLIFPFMMECAPESGRCHYVYVVGVAYLGEDTIMLYSRVSMGPLSETIAVAWRSTAVTGTHTGGIYSFNQNIKAPCQLLCLSNLNPNLHM